MTYFYNQRRYLWQSQLQMIISKKKFEYTAKSTTFFSTLAESNVTDANLILDFCYLNIDIRKIKEVAISENIQAIRLLGIDIRDEELSFLKNKNKLCYLNLSATPLTGKFLSFLPSFHSLRTLELGFTQLNDRNAKYLNQFSELTKLIIQQTNISDKAIASLKSLEKLKELDLSYTLITNQALREVSGFKHLEILKLKNCKNLTKKQIDHLSLQLPALQIRT